jgi:hypothetical protein
MAYGGLKECNMPQIKIIKAFLGCALALGHLSACATTVVLSSEPIEGVVHEEGTNKPVPAALVVVRWQGHVGYTGTVCYHVETATTDTQGRYRIPAWNKPSPYGGITNRQWSVKAYKSGYQLAKRYPVNNPLLQPFTEGKEERLKYLERVFGSSGCGVQDASEKNLIPFLNALQDEAQNLVKTKEEKKLVESIRYALEKIELGYEQAQKLHLERVQGR